MSKTIKLIFLALFLSPHLAGQVIFVNTEAQGNNDGSSWTDAFTSLHDALGYAQYGDSIWLAQGIYYPDEGSGDRAVYYHLKNGVAIFGGFEGTETLFEERNWEIHETILSGDIGMPINPFDNSYTLIYTEYCDTNTIIDGLIIRDGRANGSEPVQSYGGGLFVEGAGLGNSASPIIRNCVFQNNYSHSGGAGIYYNGIDSGAVCVRVNNCNFLNNICSGFGLGGAIYKKGGSVPTQNANISNSYFASNQGASGGAILYRNDKHLISNLVIDSCSFIDNFAIYNLGAIGYVDEISDSINVEINHCLFKNNNTWKAGGAIGLSAMNNNYFIKDCLFENNNAGFGGSDDTGVTQGGAISLGYNGWILEPPDSVVHIINCVFKNNASDYGGAIALGNVHLNTINCLFDENVAGIGGGAIYSERGYFFHTDFNAINSTFTKNFSYEKGGHFFCNDVNGLFGKSTFNLINSIVWNNKSIEDINKLILRGVHFKMDHSIVDFETCDTSIVDLANNNSNNYTLNCGDGMRFNENPLFKDTANHIYELDLCSPAINAGNTLAIDTFGLLYDLQGNERIQSGVVDMGAFENGDFSASVFQINPVSCFGGNDGSINFELIGCPPFVFQWENGNEIGQSVDSLIAGNYSVTVSDSVDQMQVFEAVLSEPSQIEIDFTTINATAADSMNGEIILNSITGGTPPYSLNWSTGDTTLILENLLPGNYDLVVTDANSCEYEFSILVDFVLKTDFSYPLDYRILLHPNPANTIVNITLNKPITTDDLNWTLMTTNGQIIQTEKLRPQYNDFKIDLQNIPAGLYFWKIESARATIAIDKLIILK